MDRYENCTFVDGNLEITMLERGPYNLSFLSSIREVILSVDVHGILL